MNNYQLDVFSSTLANGIDIHYKPFAIPIIQTLYTKADSLNIEGIYNLFNNKHKDLVRNTIDILERLSLIEIINVDNTNKSEKRYKITDYGETFLLEFYNTHQQNFNN
jgi:predicted transcriptional regulator